MPALVPFVFGAVPFAGGDVGEGTGALVALGWFPTDSFGVFFAGGDFGAPFGTGVVVAFFWCRVASDFSSDFASAVDLGFAAAFLADAATLLGTSAFLATAFLGTLAFVIADSAFLVTPTFVGALGLDFVTSSFDGRGLEDLTFAIGAGDVRFPGALLAAADREGFFALVFAFDDTIDSLLRAKMRPLSPI